jgi:hypothetical protein
MNEQYNSQFKILLKSLDAQQKKQINIRGFSLFLLVFLFFISLFTTYPINIY